MNLKTFKQTCLFVGWFVSLILMVLSFVMVVLCVVAQRPDLGWKYVILMVVFYLLSYNLYDLELKEEKKQDE